MNNPKISVIVPVYNVEKYLCQCIDSILAQTFTDFELLIVDDGSTDRSGEICDEYAGKDARIKVFHTTNKGVSAARNLGIKKSSADWLCFVDSDDWVESDYLRDLYGNGFSKNECIVCQRIFFEYECSHEKDKILFPYSNTILRAPFDVELVMKHKILEDFFVFAKLFNKVVIIENRILFCEDISISEDVTFLRTYLQYVKEVRLRSSFLYHYMKRNIISLSNKFHSSEEWIRASEVLMRANIGLLKSFAILNCDYAKKICTYNGLFQLYFACMNANEDNYSSVFEFVRSNKYLFDKYFHPFNIEQRLFKYLFFVNLIPCRWIFVVMKQYMRILKVGRKFYVK